MLSQKFEQCVRELIQEKMNVKEHEKTHNNPNEMWGMTTSYSQIFQQLRNISVMLQTKYPKDSSDYNNYVCNGLLDVNIENDGLDNNTQLDKQYKTTIVQNLKYLDYMQQESQNIVSTIIDAININYVMPEQLFEIINTSKLHTETSMTALVLCIHFNRMMQKIHFVWKQKPELYFPDITQFSQITMKYQVNYTPMNTFPANTGVLYRMFDSPSRNDIRALIRFSEEMNKKYKSINLIVMKQHIQKEIKQKTVVAPQQVVSKQCVQKPVLVPQRVVPKKKYTFGELNILKVEGLQGLCAENDIYLKSNARRDDYVKALMKLQI